MKKSLTKLEGLDRRWIYLIIFIAVLVPFITRLDLPVGRHSPSTTAIYDYIEELPPGSIIAIAFDYGPSAMPELEPAVRAMVRHAFERDHRIFAMTIHPQGALMIRRVLYPLAEEYGKQAGVDYINAGFKPGGVAVILGMGRDIVRVFEDTDARGQRLSSMPMMQDLRTYDDIAILVDLAANTLPLAWVAYAHEQYRVQIGAAVTAVVATDLYTFWKSGQLVGLINGLKGAAEYEDLVSHPGWGVQGMSSQSIAHVLIILLIVLGNISYFASRRRAQA
ncbi:MAG: hypothetical protein GX358_10005 [candidate division WS1 bacterium]|nr:hypothetical protein [candidate division WS1 bacterium]